MEKGQRGSLRQLNSLVDWLVVGVAVMAGLTRCLAVFHSQDKIGAF